MCSNIVFAFISDYFYLYLCFLFRFCVHTYFIGTIILISCSYVLELSCNVNMAKFKINIRSIINLNLLSGNNQLF